MTVLSGVVRSLLLAVLLSMTPTDLAPSVHDRGGPAIVRDAIAGETAAGVGVAGEERRCEAYCSPTTPGVSVMEITWPVAHRPMDAAELQAHINQQALEVTVYHEGFKRGLFARVSAVTTAREFQAVQATGSLEKGIPGLEHLVITEITTSKDTNATTRLEPTGAGGEEVVVVKVEGLHPGLIYTWRTPVAAGQSRTPHAVIRCQAAICPVDVMKE